MNTTSRQVVFIVRPVHFKGATLYIGAHRASDHQWIPFGLYAAKDPFHIKKIDQPGNPWDLLVKNGVLYVLSAIESDKDKTKRIIRVTATRDIKAWQPLFQFESPSFARSFEYLNDVFYFGLGCETDDLGSETGDILRMPWKPKSRQHYLNPQSPR